MIQLLTTFHRYNNNIDTKQVYKNSCIWAFTPKGVATFRILMENSQQQRHLTRDINNYILWCILCVCCRKKMKKNYGMNQGHTNSCYIVAYMYIVQLLIRQDETYLGYSITMCYRIGYALKHCELCTQVMTRCGNEHSTNTYQGQKINLGLKSHQIFRNDKIFMLDEML